MFASLLQAVGVLILTAAAYLAWGLPPGLAVLGVGMLLFGLAVERGR